MDSAQLQIVITAIDEASAGLAKISDSLKELGGMSDEVNTELANGSKASADAIDGVTVAADREVASVERLSAGLAQVAAVQRATLDATTAQTGAIEKQTAVIEDNKASFSKLGTGAAVGAVAIGYAIDKTVSSYANLQTQMTKLATSAGEQTSKLGMVTAGVQNVARATGTSTTDLGNAMYYVESAGFHGANGLNVLMAAAKGAKDEQASALSVADATSTILNSYGLSAGHATEAVNGMITAVSHGKTTLQLFSSSLSSVLPIAAAVHISFAQVAGALATMTAQGMTAQQAAQDLRHTIASLSNPTTVQTKELLQLGLNSQTVAQQLGSKGLTGTIGELTTAILAHMGPAGMVMQSALQNSTIATADLKTELAAMPDSLRNISQEAENGQISWTAYRTAIRSMSLANQSLGAGFLATYQQANTFNNQLKAGTPDAITYEAALSKATGGQNGLTTALMLSGTHTQTFKDNVDAVAKSMSNATDKVLGWSDMQGTFNQQMSELKEDFVTLGQQMGQVLIPMLAMVAKTLGIVFAPLADLITKFPVVAAVILFAAGAFLTFIAAMIGIRKVTAYFSDATKELRTLIGATEDQTIVARLAAVADTVWGVATDGVTAATVALQAALDTMGIGELLMIIAAILAGLIALGVGIDKMITHWQDVVGFLSDMWNDIGNLFKSNIGIVLALLVPFIGIPVYIMANWQKLLNFFDTLWTDIPTIIHGKIGPILAIIFPFMAIPLVIMREWDKLTAFFSRLWGDIPTGFHRGGDLVLAAMIPFIGLPILVIQKWTAIKDFFNQLFTSPVAAFHTFVAAITDSWNSLVNDAQFWAVKLWHAIEDGFAAVMTDVPRVGKDLVYYIEQGWNGALADSSRLAKDLIYYITKGMEAFNTDLERVGKDLVYYIGKGLGKAKDDVVQWGKDLANGIKNGLESLASWDVSQLIDWYTALDKWWQEIDAWAKSIPGKLGKDFNAWGQEIDKWIKSIPNKITHDLDGWWQAMDKWIKSIPTKVTADLVKWWQSVDTWFRNLPKTLEASLTQSGKQMADKHVESFAAVWKDGKKVTEIALAVLAAITLIPFIIASVITVQMVIFGIKIITWIIEGIMKAIGLLVNIGRWIWNEIEPILAGASTWLYQTGKDIIGGLVKGITDSIGAVGSAIKSVGTTAVSGLKGILGIHSPSTVFAEIGQNVDAGLKQGITSNKQVATQAATDLAESTITGAKQGLSSSTATGIANGASASTSNMPLVGKLEVTFNGPILGNQQQAQQFATQMYQALQQIARQHGAADQMPSIGIRPI